MTIVAGFFDFWAEPAGCLTVFEPFQLHIAGQGLTAEDRVMLIAAGQVRGPGAG